MASDISLPGIAKMVVVSRDVKGHGMGVLNVRWFSTDGRHTAALIVADRKAIGHRLIVTEPFICQNPVLDELNQIWSYGWTRNAENKESPTNHPVLMRIDSMSGKGDVVLRKNDVSAAESSISFGDAKADASGSIFRAFVPLKNRLLLYGKKDNAVQEIAGPGAFDEPVNLQSVTNCRDTEIFVSAKLKSGQPNIWVYKLRTGQ